MALVCGVEEAGRGPVIGPMVMAAVMIDKEDSDKLKSLGAKDSKLLTPRTRELLVPQIKSIAKKFEIVIIPPKEIDDAVLSDTLNLNWLEAIKSAELVNKLNPDKVILDCPSTNTKAYTAYFKKHLKNQDIEIISEHKADLNYPVVSAASIIAKVARDEEIEKLKQKHNVNFGSGYPSDPRTKGFIQKYFDKYDFFRKSWSTFQNAAGEKKQKRMGDFN